MDVPALLVVTADLSTFATSALEGLWDERQAPAGNIKVHGRLNAAISVPSDLSVDLGLESRCRSLSVYAAEFWSGDGSGENHPHIGTNRRRSVFWTVLINVDAVRQT